MSEQNQKSKSVTPIAKGKNEAEPPTREERAMKLHHDIKLANPGRNVEVTVGEKYGPDSVHIKTESGITGDVMGGVALGILGIGAVTGLVLVGLKIRETRAAAKLGREEPIEVSED